MIGSSAAFRRVVEQATQVARSDARVLLTGESGTGKELLADAHPPQQPVRGRPVREGELRGHPGGPARERAVRPREGRVHRRDVEPARQVRAGRRRDDLPRRGGRPARGVAGQAAARAAGRRVPARRRRRDAPRRGARRLGDEPGPGRAGRGEEVPRGPLLPAERRADPRAAAARAARGHPAAGRVLRGRVLPPQQLPAEADRRRRCSRNSRAYRWPGNIRELRNVVERMAILAPDPITADAIPVEIRLSRQPDAPSTLEETRAHGRARAHPAGARGGRAGTCRPPRARWASSGPGCTSGSRRWAWNGNGRAGVGQSWGRRLACLSLRYPLVHADRTGPRRVRHLRHAVRRSRRRSTSRASTPSSTSTWRRACTASRCSA